MGGFSVALYETFLFMAGYFGSKPIIQKFIRKLYFESKTDETDGDVEQPGLR